MTNTLLILLLLTLVIGILWLRVQLELPRCKTLLFLTLRAEGMEKSLLLRKPLLVRFPPVPGMELDGQGIEVAMVARSVIDDGPDYDVLVHLELVTVPVANFDNFTKGLVEDCGWEKLW